MSDDLAAVSDAEPLPSVVDDVEAIRFSNEKIRPLCDQMVRSYRLMKTIAQMWTAKDLARLFPAEGLPIADGSIGPSPDGRTPITSADVRNVIAFCLRVNGAIELGDGTILNQLLKVAVNPD